MKAYKELRPVAPTVGYGSGVDAAMVLGNGTVVRHAEDLMPVVGDDPAFANYVQKSKRKSTIGNFLLYPGAIVAIVGISVMSASIMHFGSTLSWVGIGLGVGGLAAELTGVGLGLSASVDEQAAFAIYDNALQKRLGVNHEIDVKDVKDSRKE
ncbi:MAG: hypothetical protein V4534_07865 [Myxococcota bacterium]